MFYLYYGCASTKMKSFWHNLTKPFFVLAPMADVTDAAFRSVIAKYGKPDVVFTEFVSADGLFKGGYDALSKDLIYSEEERPIVAQFFSKDLDLMAKAANLGEEMNFDGIDINMGCPDKNVCKQGAGAAMIKDPEHAQKVIRAAKEATGLPVSVKTRIGFNTISIEEWIPALLETEPVVITLHGRTRKEMSKVPAQWDVIARAVEIRNEMKSDTLIVGNGDVKDLPDARERAKESSCDGVMIARGIYGNPWLFSEKGRPELKERLVVLAEHIKLYEELLGETKPFHIMKNHFKSYVSGSDGDKAITVALMDTKTAEEALTVIQDAV